MPDTVPQAPKLDAPSATALRLKIAVIGLGFLAQTIAGFILSLLIVGLVGDHRIDPGRGLLVIVLSLAAQGALYYTTSDWARARGHAFVARVAMSAFYWMLAKLGLSLALVLVA